MLTGSFERHINSCGPRANINRLRERKEAFREENGDVGKS